jgi:hypothetical protein
MQEHFDDDDEQAVFTLNLHRACETLLADFTQGERWPSNVDPDRDRYPRLFLAPVRANMWGSPAALCADLAAPGEADGRRR